MRRFIPSMAALTAFEAAAAHLNFSRAAEQLNLSQSGISRQIKVLEDFLGARLFERHGPRLVLTEAGRVYSSDITHILDELESVSIDVVRGMKSDLALRIGALPSVASRWLAPRMERFSSLHPSAFYDIEPTTNVSDFTESNLDIAILRGGTKWLNARSVVLFDEKICVVASPRLIPLGQKLETEAFSSYPQLQHSARPDSWMKWLTASNQLYHGRLKGQRFGHTSMLINAAVAGLGLAVVPHFLVQKELESGELFLPFGPPIASGDQYFVVFSERDSHRQDILMFRDWLLRETRALRAPG